MKTIWKYELQPVDFQTLEMPKDSRILCCQTQNDNPCLWAVVNPKAETVKRKIRIAGTGHPLQEGVTEYLGTVQTLDGRLVLHVFEIL